MPTYRMQYFWCGLHSVAGICPVTQSGLSKEVHWRHFIQRPATKHCKPWECVRTNKWWTTGVPLCPGSQSVVDRQNDHWDPSRIRVPSKVRHNSRFRISIFRSIIVQIHQRMIQIRWWTVQYCSIVCTLSFITHPPSPEAICYLR